MARKKENLDENLDMFSKEIYARDMMKKTSSRELDNVLLNSIMQQVCTLWEYGNLPPEVSSWFIERVLFDKGRNVWFKVGDLILVTPVVETKQKDIYFEATTVQPYAPTLATNFARTNGVDCVVMKANLNNYPPLVTIKPFLNRLGYIWRTMGNNLSQSRMRLGIRGSQDQAKAIKKEVNNLCEEDPIATWIDKNAKGREIEAISHNIPFEGKELMDFYQTVESKMYSFLGVDNTSIIKQSGVSEKEIQANNEQIFLARQSMLETRQDAINKINKMFNLNITIKLREPKVEQKEVKLEEPKYEIPPNLRELIER